MVLGSHNSWSYLTPKKWWMKPFRFVAKCQDVDIKTQYDEYGVKCFDLRLCFGGKSGNELQVNHNYMIYDISSSELLQHLKWLDIKGDVSVRILLDVRNKKKYTTFQRACFRYWCNFLSEKYTHIKFWCGRNLYNWEEEYHFDYNPSCDEKYSSVCKPKWIDDWYPKLFARKNNHTIIQEMKEKESNNILLIDFVNIK